MPALLTGAFIMLVYCAPNANTCRVEWAQGRYPSAAQCAQVAPKWLEVHNHFERRKAAGAFCELAQAPPVPYTVPRCRILAAQCGHRSNHGQRATPQADSAEGAGR